MGGLGPEMRKSSRYAACCGYTPEPHVEVQGQWIFSRCFSKFTQDSAKGLEGTTEQVVISCGE
jgi:hypothetical protein